MTAPQEERHPDGPDPGDFDQANPCIVTGPSSGSRGVYGAIGSSGDWGLKHGWRSPTPTPQGTGYQDLAADKVNLRDGRLVPHAEAGALAQFASDLTGDALTAFNTAFPTASPTSTSSRSRTPRRTGARTSSTASASRSGRSTRRTRPIDAASGKHTRTITPANTIVISSSISNGGGESLQALEQDTEGLIDGIAVAEPTRSRPA